MRTPDAIARTGRFARNEIVVDPRSRGETRVWEAAHWALAWFPALLLPVVALVIVGPMFRAALGPVDDWVIPQILAAHGGSVSWLQVPAIAAQQAAEASRFRPFYWLVWVVETAGWGTFAPGWYLDRLLLLIATLGLAAWVARRFAGPAIATTGALLVVIGPQAASWFRLGPQEAIATPLVLAGVALVLGRRWQLAGVAFVLAALTKESFVPFAAVGVVGMWLAGGRRAASVGGLAVTAIAGVVLELRVTGVDQYHLARDPAAFAQTASWMLTAAPAMWFALPALLLVRTRRERIVALVATGLIASQVFLYAGLPDAHYLLPAALIGAAAAVFALERLRERWSRFALASAAALLLALVPVVLGLRASAEAAAASSHLWASDVDAVADALRAHPGDVLVVSTGRWPDLEPAAALLVYLPSTPAMLVAPTIVDDSELGRRVTGILEEAAKTGGLGYVAGPPVTPCVAVSLSGAPAFPGCDVELEVRY